MRPIGKMVQSFLAHNPDLGEPAAPQVEAEPTQQLADKFLEDQERSILKMSLAGPRPRR